MKDDSLYLIHIGECIERIEKYTKMGKDDFVLNQLTQDAVMRNLQTLAESTKRLSDSFKTSHPEVDWKGIAGFRNVAVHDYLGIDPLRIWDIVQKDIPDLKLKITPLIPKR
ncbi:MAG: hypothetical protein A2901_07975 [Elusimicrobia bacterium RIFCSPLOWO2_01_FULL_54_10]|nr:MAG: hypothetical protein A2901_07975 [Elusimicrobia bacterium RIFCSPLOWO2_01_FULL_54_10]